MDIMLADETGSDLNGISYFFYDIYCLIQILHTPGHPVIVIKHGRMFNPFNRPWFNVGDEQSSEVDEYETDSEGDCLEIDDRDIAPQTGTLSRPGRPVRARFRLAL